MNRDFGADLAGVTGAGGAARNVVLAVEFPLGAGAPRKVVLGPASTPLLGSGLLFRPKNDPVGDKDLKLKALFLAAADMGGDVGLLCSAALMTLGCDSIEFARMLRLILYLPAVSIPLAPAFRFFLKLLSESESLVSSRCSLVLTCGGSDLP